MKAKKSKPEYQPTADDIQPILLQIKKLRESVMAVKKEGGPATAQVVYMWVVNELKVIERMTLVARSGPGILEELRSEGHDV